MARASGVEPRVLDAVQAVNDLQKDDPLRPHRRALRRQAVGPDHRHLGTVVQAAHGRRARGPGPGVDRFAVGSGVKIQVHDPEAMANVRQSYGEKLAYLDDQYQALQGADALAIMTEWKEFVQPDFELMRRLMKSPVIFDGRNVFQPETLQPRASPIIRSAGPA